MIILLWGIIYIVENRANVFDNIRQKWVFNVTQHIMGVVLNHSIDRKTVYDHRKNVLCGWEVLRNCSKLPIYRNENLSTLSRGGFHKIPATPVINQNFYVLELELRSNSATNFNAQWGKSLPGKFEHLEGNYDFSHQEIHKTWWEFIWKCNHLPGKFTFCPALLTYDLISKFYDLPIICMYSLKIACTYQWHSHYTPFVLVVFVTIIKLSSKLQYIYMMINWMTETKTKFILNIIETKIASFTYVQCLFCPLHLNW